VAHGGTVPERPRTDLGGLTNTDAPLPATQPTWWGLLVSGRSMRYAAGVLLIAAGYYVAAQSGETLLLTGGVGAFWPATGVGVALLYVGGLRWWPGILLGDLVGTIVDLPGDPQPLGIALADTTGHVARAVVAVIVLQRLAGRRAAMDRLAQVGAVFVAVAVGEALAATVAILARWAGGVIEVPEMAVFWRSWWLGGVAGGLVVVPLALAWAHGRPSVWRGRRAGEGALMLAAVAGLSVIALSAEQPLT
jgi:integral membrane sensor domain MASE1